MSFVVAVPDFIGSAATDLTGIGSTLSAANAAAAIPTTEILAAAEDEISTAIAALPATPRPIKPPVPKRRRLAAGLCRP